MPIATLSSAPALSAGAIEFRPLATPSRGSTELTTWLASLAPHASSARHTLDHEQLMMVAQGVLTLTTREATVTATPGDVLILPAPQIVELTNEADELAAATVIGPVGFTVTVGGETFAPPWSL